MANLQHRYKSDHKLSLIALSLPFLFMSLANFAASMINTLVLALVPNQGIIYSEAVGVASKIYLIFSVLTTFVISGIGVVVSQKIGQKESTAKLHEAIYTALSATIIFTLIITVLAEIISPFVLFAFLNPGTQQYQNALIYVEVISLTTLLIIPKNALGAIVNSYGYVKQTIIWNVVGIIIDTALTLIFVLVIDLGVLGSAMGTIIAHAITFIYAFIIFNKKVIHFRFRELKLNPAVTKTLLKTSIPIGFERVSYTFAMLVVGIFVAQIGFRIPSFLVKDGTSEVNLLNLGNTIIETFSNIITITSIAFSQGAIIICARQMGAQDYLGAKKIIQKAFIISLIADLAMALIFFFIQPFLIDFFKLTQPETVQIYFNQWIRKIAFIPFLLLIILQIGRTVNIIYLTGPMTYGNLIINSIFSVLNTWIVVIIFGFGSLYTANDRWGSVFYGINGIYFLKTLDELFRGLFNFYWWKSGRWNQDHKKLNCLNQSI